MIVATHTRTVIVEQFNCPDPHNCRCSWQDGQPTGMPSIVTMFPNVAAAAGVNPSIQYTYNTAAANPFQVHKLGPDTAGAAR